MNSCELTKSDQCNSWSRKKYDQKKVHFEDEMTSNYSKMTSYEGKYNNKNNCIGVLGKDKLYNVPSEKINFNSVLIGLKGNDNPDTKSNIMMTIPNCCNNIDYTRLTNSSSTLRGTGFNSFDAILENPQDFLLNPTNMSKTGINSKEYARKTYNSNCSRKIHINYSSALPVQNQSSYEKSYDNAFCNKTTSLDYSKY